MIVSLALILLAQLLGEAVAHASGAPVPGPVIGAALMFGFLLIRDRYRSIATAILPRPLVEGGLETTAKGLLAHLSLMFVPAGVGIVGRLDVLTANGLALAIVLIVSVVLTLSATALTLAAVSRIVRPPEDSP
ncbi:CidA/LrgA family protein [Methylobacterium gnaphalii]|uniref:CidA/LrgA family protein n=1 Tax=Methylobacterium gnaphalii TaxID=1010610 RepID=A0A512JRZ9_9HYPH|nr:CidA/LrgA family protein [Methylobacterium gnaphalii]GEP12730.1 CidA/LrgA family protein [Methylobacterium gnaphalii]GJD71545.1 Holin-like protein CidA [Methylobacterium gnaphalii]GLS48484.1 CidA/LrgA family protein [Methylobacterium gnaphalii]